MAFTVPKSLLQRTQAQVREALRGGGLSDLQIRNGLVSAQHSGRVLKRGTHARYLYRINPRQPVASVRLARVTAGFLPYAAGGQPQAPAITPVWPAAAAPRGFTAPAVGPRLRIAA